MTTFVLQDKDFRIVEDDGAKDLNCKTCAFNGSNDQRCVDVDYVHPHLPMCTSNAIHYEEVSDDISNGKEMQRAYVQSS